MRKPEGMTDFMNEGQVTVGAGRKLPVPKIPRQVLAVVLPDRISFLVRKVMRASKRITVGTRSPLGRQRGAVRPRFEFVRSRRRGKLLRRDIRDIGPLLQRGAPSALLEVGPLMVGRGLVEGIGDIAIVPDIEPSPTDEHIEEYVARVVVGSRCDRRRARSGRSRHASLPDGRAVATIKSWRLVRSRAYRAGPRYWRR